MMNLTIKTFLPGLLLIVFVAACSQTSPSSAQHQTDITFDQTTLMIGGQEISVELARTPTQRRRGLSRRTSLPPNNGMLFIYKDSRIRHFTMRETLIPLAIVFIAESGEILEIHEMQAGEQKGYPSEFPAMYALEMNTGWFRKAGVKTGQIIDLTGVHE